MKQIFQNLILVVLINFTFSSCGIQLEGTFTGFVEGQHVSIKFEQDGKASLKGYFPKILYGNWVEEKTFGDPQIWATFDGPEEKPFRIRFEFKAENSNFRLIGIKARPMGKGTTEI